MNIKILELNFASHGTPRNWHKNVCSLGAKTMNDFSG